MEKKFKQFKDSAEEVRLSDEAFSRMRQTLLVYARSHPASSPYARFFGTPSPFSWLLKPVMVPLVLLLSFGGVSSFAASGALPGDTLYPLKVNLVEPVKGLFALSPEAEAVWHITLTNERLSEFEKLAVQEKLTPEEGTKGQERFDRSLSEAEERIEKLSKDDPNTAEKIDASLTASLDEHERILSTIGNSTSSKGAVEAKSLALHVKGKLEKKMPSVATTMTMTMTASTSTTTPSADAATTTASSTSPEEEGEED